MRHFFILSIFVLISFSVQSQNRNILGATLGTTSEYTRIYGLFGKNNFVIKTGLVVKRKDGTIGENYSSTINWSQFPEDVYEEGSYIDFYDLGFNYIIKDKIAIGIIYGFGKKIIYRNCFDKTHILGNDGEYFKRKDSDERIGNVMFDFNYLHNVSWGNLIFGTNWGSYTKFGIEFGAAINL